MGLLLLCLFLVFFISSYIAFVIMDRMKLGIILALGIVFVLLPVGLWGGVEPPIIEYKYEATIKLNRYHVVIYFDEFKQDGKNVVLSSYAKKNACHWLDFNDYNIIEEPLVIYLTGENFVYTDRETGEEIGNEEKNIATQ